VESELRQLLVAITATLVPAAVLSHFAGRRAARREIGDAIQKLHDVTTRLESEVEALDKLAVETKERVAALETAHNAAIARVSDSLSRMELAITAKFAEAQHERHARDMEVQRSLGEIHADVASLAARYGNRRT
jgi:hypothetical protein